MSTNQGRPFSMSRSRALLVFAGTALAAGSMGSGPESAFGLIERANEAYREGRVELAVNLYEEAEGLSGEDALTLYNWGTALAAKDERGLSERMFRKADQLAGDSLQSEELRSRARFNLAHSLFVTASTLTEEDPERAIELFDESAAAAKSALRMNPDDVEAAQHVEISRLAAQLVRDQLALAERVRELANRQREQSEASQDAHQEQQETEQQQEQPEQDQESGEQDQQPGEQPPEQPEQPSEQQQPEESGEPSQTPDLPSWLENLLGPEQPGNQGESTPDEPETEDQTPPEQAGEGDEPTQEQQTPPPQPGGQDQQSGEQDRQPGEAPEQGPGGSPPEDPPFEQDQSPEDQLEQAQSELNSQTEGIAETLRKAIENDMVAGDRDFVEAVLRAIEDARKNQDDAEVDLQQQEFDAAADEQEQAADLLEMAEEMLNQGQPQRPENQQEPPPGDQDPEQQPGEGEGDGEPDEDAQNLLEKERREREMRRAYQRRVMRGRRAPERDW